MAQAISENTRQNPIVAATKPPQSNQVSKLPPEKQSALNDVLKDYDAKSLSQSDAANLTKEIEDLGLRSGRELDAALSKAGFDPQEVTDKANAAASTPPPPPQISGPSREAIATLSRLVDQNEKEENAPLDVKSIASQLANEGFDTSKPLVDVLV